MEAQKITKIPSYKKRKVLANEELTRCLKVLLNIKQSASFLLEALVI